MTLKQVRARYRNGVLEPLDAIQLRENQEVLLTLDDYTNPTAEDAESFRRAAGGWVGQFDDPDQLIRDLYQARIDGSREPPAL
jgi:predicted DNA-binding antitoxin AbrB/MazE fold protein